MVEKLSTDRKKKKKHISWSEYILTAKTEIFGKLGFNACLCVYILYLSHFQFWYIFFFKFKFSIFKSCFELQVTNGGDEFSPIKTWVFNCDFFFFLYYGKTRQMIRKSYLNVIFKHFYTRWRVNLKSVEFVVCGFFGVI